MIKHLTTWSLLLLFCIFAEATEQKPRWECKRFTEENVILKGDAVIRDGKLILNGETAYAEIPGSQDIQLTKSGMTLSITVKLNDQGTKDGKNDAHDMFFCKEGTFLFARDARRYYTNFHNGKKYCGNLKGGVAPEPGVWTHLAAVFEYVNDQAQGDVGYQVRIYENGDPVCTGKFLWAEPVGRDLPVMLGRGLGGGPWMLNGEIGEAAIFDRALSEGEIAELFQQNVYTAKIPKGFTEIEEPLAGQIADMKKKYDHPVARWIIDSLARSAFTGYPQEKIRHCMKKYEKMADIQDLRSLQDKFNRDQEDLHLYLNQDMAVLVLLGKGKGAHPLAGLYSMRTQKDIFGEQTISWTIFGKNGGKPVEVRYNAPEGSWESQMENDSTLKIRWTFEEPLKFTVDSRVSFSGSRVESDFQVSGIKGLLTEVNYPQFTFARLNSDGRDALVYPYMSGILLKNPIVNELSTGQSGIYPSGGVSMQFGAYYDDETGIYFGYEDGLARTKKFAVWSKRGNLNAAWTSPVPFQPNDATNSFRMNGKAVVALYQGEWYDAGTVYRRFLERDAAWWIRELPRKDTPESFRNNTLTIKLTMSKETGVEQCRDMTAYLKQYFEHPVMIHWYGWDQFDKAGWPHFIPQDFSLRLAKQIIAAGNYVVPYIDGRLWKVKDGPDNTDWMYQSHGSKYAIRNPDGSINTEYYHTKGEFAIMCPAAEGWQKVLIELIKRLADYGFSGAYHDQVTTGKPICCFNPAHGHPMNDGALWLEKGYWPIFQQIRKNLQGSYPDFYHTSEDNSEPYLKCVDGFHVWRWSYQGIIPLFQSLYSGRAQFEGLTYSGGVQHPGDKQSFFCKAARQTVYSEQLGGFQLSELGFPDERRLFIKKCAHIRTVLLPYFNEGRMLAPIRYTVSPAERTQLWGGYTANPVTLPVIESCAWQGPDGSKIFVFANAGAEMETVKLADRAECWICREGAAEPGKSDDPVVTMKPRSFEIRVFGSAEEAERIQKTLRRFASFDYGKSAGMSIQYIPKKISARAGELITVKDAAGVMACALTTDRHHAGYIQDDALIFFDEVDFGPHGSDKIAVNVSVDPKLEGGTILMVLTEPNGNESVVGQITLKSTGGFSEYQDQTFTLDRKLQGRQKIHFQFKGNSICNFRGWKFY